MLALSHFGSQRVAVAPGTRGLPSARAVSRSVRSVWGEIGRGEASIECVECGFLATFVAANQIVTLVLRASAVFVSRSLLGHGFGALPAPGGNSLFCFDCIALRVTVSARKLVRKVRRQVFSGASVNAELRPWEPGPSLASLSVTRAGRGNSTKRRRNHEQSQPHRIHRR